jgi:hypothetical protein
LQPATIAFAQEAPPPAGEVAPAAVFDTPQVVTSDAYDAYYLAAGLLYYSRFCYASPILAAAEAAAATSPNAPTLAVRPAAPEGGTFQAYLRRTPVNGGFGSTIDSITGDAPDCYRYKLLTADADGVFYDVRTGDSINELPLRVEFRPGGASGPPVVVANTSAATYPVGTRMASDATYIYWATPTGVVRARKDGTSPAPELMADGLVPTDILVIGQTLYIATLTGIYTVQTTTPSAEVLFSSVGGHSMTHRFGSGGTIFNPTSQLYWVMPDGGTPTTPAGIHFRSCSTIFISCSEGDAYLKPTNDGVDWYLGRPAFYQTSMFWHEANTLSGDIGSLRRKVLGSLPVTASDELAPNIANNNTPVFVEGTSVFYSDNRFSPTVSYAVKKLSVLATPIVRDLKADALEITQGIQTVALQGLADPFPQVPLAAKKLTFVRAYGLNLAGPQASNVQAWLYGTRNGIPLPGSPLKPTNGTRSLAVGGTYNRGTLNSGWLFQLPASWVQAGSTVLRLVVDPLHQYNEDAPALVNNEFSRTAAFQSQPPACATYVPVHTHNPTTSTNMPNFWDMVGRFKRLWPMPSMLNFSTDWQAEETQVCWYGPFPYPCGGPFELNEGASVSDWIPDKDEAIAVLWAYDLIHYAPACDDAGGYTHYMGLVHPQAATGTTSGYASTVSAQSWVKLPPASPNPFPNTWNAMRQSAVMAQELSHNFGRKHINCGNPGDIDGAYPYPPCQIAATGNTSYYGFDSKTLTPIAPTAASDFMTYSSPNWVSDYTWRAVMNAVALSSSEVSAAEANASLIISADGTVLVGGHLDTQKILGQLNYAKVLPEGSLSASMTEKLLTVAVSDYHEHEVGAADANHGGEPDASNFHVQLLDDTRPVPIVLADKTVTLLPIDDHDPSVSAQIFQASFPAPAGTVAKVQLLADATVLDDLTPGITPPTVSVLQPTGGSTVQDSMTVAWQASDADNDPLIFNIQYSYDAGVHWQALAGDIPGTPNPNYQTVFLNLSNLHGSAANEGLVRVIASDGYNTTIGTSQPFTLANRKPLTFITDPSSGMIYNPQGPVTLEGGASDAEDGALEGARLTWKLNGTAVATDTYASLSGLAPGTYPTLLEAKDSNNNLGTASATLTVGTLSIPLGNSAAMDGFCDDATYAGGAQIALAPYADAEKSQATVHIVRDANYLWACFTGLKKGAQTPGAFAGLRFDVDNSRDAKAQTTDFGFFVGENGGFFTYAGDGAGGFALPGPGGLQGQISADVNTTTWSAELRISRNVVGDWNHLVGLKAGHYSVASQGNDYGWPYAPPAPAVFNAPNTWARAALGLVPMIGNMSPFSMTVGSPDLVLTIEGENFDANAQLLWNGNAISVTTNAVVAAIDPNAVQAADADASEEALAVSSATLISATIPASQFATAGTATIVVRNSGPLDSAPVTININNPQPVIANLVPAQVKAFSPGFVLTVNGGNFVNGATVLWDGAALPTTFGGGNKLTAQVNAGLLGLGADIGITVRNPAPVEVDSDAAPFTVTPDPNRRTYLPVIDR